MRSPKGTFLKHTTVNVSQMSECQVKTRCTKAYRCQLTAGSMHRPELKDEVGSCAGWGGAQTTASTEVTVADGGNRALGGTPGPEAVGFARLPTITAFLGGIGGATGRFNLAPGKEGGVPEAMEPANNPACIGSCGATGARAAGVSIFPRQYVLSCRVRSEASRNHLSHDWQRNMSLPSCLASCRCT